ncbi:unnamed protein product [Meloidogyne enterolobii]|uniref:Uncharacterized protein n=1 Tax=Meloidogyne enterolobii TaxID=390850 RepID=A0ACB1AJF3_MELEN
MIIACYTTMKLFFDTFICHFFTFFSIIFILRIINRRFICFVIFCDFYFITHFSGLFPFMSFLFFTLFDVSTFIYFFILGFFILLFSIFYLH